jgi:hypothetical protein
VFTARRIHRPVVLCALACGALGSMSAATAGATASKADITTSELAGRLAHERTADITAAELAGLALAGSRPTASPPLHTSEHGAPTRVEHASAPGAGIGAAATGGLILVTAGGIGAAYRARIRLAR